MRNILVALEALDGVGKSTIGPIVAKKLGGVYLSTPMGEFNERRKMANANSVARFFYYLSALSAANDEIKKLLSQGKTIVADRHIDSTFACHCGLGIKPERLVNESELAFVRPDYRFYLTASKEERLKRLRQRIRQSDYDKQLESDQELQARTHQAFLRRGLIVLDTTLLSAEQSAEAIVSEILQREARLCAVSSSC